MKSVRTYQQRGQTRSLVVLWTGLLLVTLFNLLLLADIDVPGDNPTIQQAIDAATFDVLMITTSLLQKDPGFDEMIHEYQSILEITENLTAVYIELDSEECLSDYGVKVENTGDWMEIREVLEVIIGATNASYVIILGGISVIPRPSLEIYCPEETPQTIPSDVWYVDLDADQIVDEGLSISRFPDLFHNSSALVVALQNAVFLHSCGGYTLDREVRFMIGEYETPPYGVCEECTFQAEFFDLLSTSDYIEFVGHGTPTGIYSNSLEPKFTIDYMDSIDLRTYNPVILSLGPCQTGVLWADSPTLSYEFLKAGAAAFVGRTTTVGYNLGDFVEDMEGGMRIGDALFQGMRMVVLTSGCKYIYCSHHFCLYGDPTLKLRDGLPAGLIVYVDYSVPPGGTGYDVDPFSSLHEALGQMCIPRTIRMMPGSTVITETIVIDVPVRLEKAQ